MIGKDLSLLGFEGGRDLSLFMGFEFFYGVKV